MMEQRHFQIRIHSHYEGTSNDIKDLDVEVMTKDGWQKLDLNLHTPGFLTFCYAIMACQHLYLRINAKERGLALQSSTGSLDVTTSQDWLIQKRHVRFDVQLAAGTPTSNDVEYIIDRMQYCPSTINLKDIPDANTQVNFT